MEVGQRTTKLWLNIEVQQTHYQIAYVVSMTINVYIYIYVIMYIPKKMEQHYCDARMTAMASQIASLTIV